MTFSSTDIWLPLQQTNICSSIYSASSLVNPPIVHLSLHTVPCAYEVCVLFRPCHVQMATQRYPCFESSKQTRLIWPEQESIPCTDSAPSVRQDKDMHIDEPNLADISSTCRESGTPQKFSPWCLFHTRPSNCFYPEFYILPKCFRGVWGSWGTNA